ncbi:MULTISPECIES: ATP-binding protein [Spirulina sp. CCY15215]|uniref:AAA family ATPase n=1 Tax=Spirulina sp. CCY15215 TaxID=2767591 RepID=UPI00194E567A|nr:ATP-binding protein [Spirulina major]
MNDMHFVKSIKIKNFRCFNSLTVESLSRVNLLGGYNNIGKSTFLEALEIITQSKTKVDFINIIKDIIYRRQGKNLQDNEFDMIAYDESWFELETTNNCVFLEIKSNNTISILEDEDRIDKQYNNISDTLQVELKVNDDSDKIPHSRFIDIINNDSSRYRSPRYRRDLKSSENIDFINSSTIDEIKLASLYGKVIDLGIEKEIDSFLGEFDSRLDSLVIRPTERHSVFKVKLKGKLQPVLLSSMGEGLNRYFAIICGIWKSQNGYLFIDEIENGIHYTKYEELWEIIFKISKAASCQVFATTHSRECIEAFSRVAEKCDRDNIKYINFSRTVDNPDEIVATVLESVGLEENFQLGADVR